MAVPYGLADKFYPFRRRAIDADEVFGFIVQEHQTNTQFIPARTKLSQH